MIGASCGSRRDHTESIALRIGHDDVVRVRGLLGPVHSGRAQADQPLDLRCLRSTYPARVLVLRVLALRETLALGAESCAS
jgi:hypothetical protein